MVAYSNRPSGTAGWRKRGVFCLTKPAGILIRCDAGSPFKTSQENSEKTRSRPPHSEHTALCSVLDCTFPDFQTVQYCNPAWEFGKDSTLPKYTVFVTFDIFTQREVGVLVRLKKSGTSSCRQARRHSQKFESTSNAVAKPTRGSDVASVLIPFSSTSPTVTYQ